MPENSSKKVDTSKYDVLAFAQMNILPHSTSMKGSSTRNEIPLRHRRRFAFAAVMVFSAASGLFLTSSHAATIYAQWNFEDANMANGQTAAEVNGLYSGTYINTTEGSRSTNVPSGIGSTASVSLLDSSTQYVSVGTLGSLGSQLGSGDVAFNFYIQTTDSAFDRAFGTFNSNTDGTAVALVLNSQNGADLSAGYTALFLRASTGSQQLLAYFDNTTVNLYDGNWHNVVWGLSNPTSNQFQLTIDGTPISLTYTSQTLTGASTFNNFANPFRIGAAGRDTLIDGSVTADFDNFSIQIVPEPRIVALLVVAGMLLVFRRRRQCQI